MELNMTVYVFSVESPVLLLCACVLFAVSELK